MLFGALVSVPVHRRGCVPFLHIQQEGQARKISDYHTTCSMAAPNPLQHVGSFPFGVEMSDRVSYHDL